MSCVYFIRRKSDGMIKIGFSTDASRRIGEFSGGAGMYEMLGTIDGDKAAEGALHQRFMQHHHAGEWFRPHADILKFASDIRKPQPRKPKELSQEWKRLLRVVRTLDAKQIAENCGVSLRTAQNWQAGRNEPSGDHLVEMMVQFPLMNAAVQIVTGRLSLNAL